MRKTLLAIAMTSIFATTSVVAVELKSDEQKLSYSFGLMMAKQMKANIENVDLDAFSAALNDIYSDAEIQLSEEEIAASLKKFEDKQIALQQAEAEKHAAIAKAAAAKKAQDNMDIGKKFLAENGKREGVITTKSGLQIEITKQGEGNNPTAEDTVVVHYEGTSIAGDVFDSSFKREKPATFGLGQVIKGWTEGLQHLKVGGEAKLYIPSDLAYGNQGAGASIGPGETLIFRVKLIEIVKAKVEAVAESDDK
ncbi:MAG: FKBP-type peptidyl-prolyl cis-trans isomerase [Oceanospirillaceae bacterium]|nr:FKBP-type peptidyl-prolyl cis-trans isomerase [Oceanospirillaceae bacterium]